jgi:hypothetical protein
MNKTIITLNSTSKESNRVWKFSQPKQIYKNGSNFIPTISFARAILSIWEKLLRLSIFSWKNKKNKRIDSWIKTKYIKFKLLTLIAKLNYSRSKMKTYQYKMMKRIYLNNFIVSWINWLKIKDYWVILERFHRDRRDIGKLSFNGIIC